MTNPIRIVLLILSFAGTMLVATAFSQLPDEASRSRTFTDRTRFRIESIAGNGQPGDTATPAVGRDVSVDLPFGVEYGPDGGRHEKPSRAETCAEKVTARST